MLVDINSFLTFYPQFDAIDTQILETLIAESYEELDEGWGTSRDKAVRLLVAHTLEIQNQNTLRIGGALASLEDRETINPSINFDRSMTDWFDRTIYGQEFKRLKDEFYGDGIGFMVIC